MYTFDDVEMFFHIGLPKSASTFLQKNYFPQLNFLYLGKHYQPPVRFGNALQDFERGIREIFTLSPVNIEPHHIRAAQEGIVRLANEFKCNKMFCSNEGLVGSYAESFRNGYLIAQCLNGLFAKPKLILVIRRQDRFLESLYRQAIRNGHSLRIEKFLNYKNGEFQAFRQDYRANIDLKTLRWDLLVDFYQQLLGRENLLVLPFEMLKEDQAEFLARIAHFVGVPCVSSVSAAPANARDTSFLLSIKRFFNAFLHPNLSNIIIRSLCLRPVGNWINWMGIDPDFISPSLVNRIRLFFQEGNRVLAEREGLPLEKYGYF